MNLNTSTLVDGKSQQLFSNPNMYNTYFLQYFWSFFSEISIAVHSSVFLQVFLIIESDYHN